MDSYLLSTWIFIIILAEIFTIVNIYINTQLLKDRNAHLERTSDYCVPYYLLYTHNLLLSKKFLLLTWHIWKQKISPYISKLGKAFLSEEFQITHLIYAQKMLVHWKINKLLINYWALQSKIQVSKFKKYKFWHPKTR